jgi:hypothetical protein
MSTNWIDGLNSADEVINFLVQNMSDRIKIDASHDAIIVLEFFPRLGPEFHTSPDFKEEQVQEFIQSFDYERYSLDKATKNSIEKYRSIDRIVDKLVEMLPTNVKDEIIRKYLLEVWFSKNSKSDLKHFKDSLVKDYWFKK